MRRRRLAIALALVVGGAGVVVLFGLLQGGADGGGVGPSSVRGLAAARSAVSPAVLLLGSRRDPWLAFVTDVNPGGGVQFVSARVGFVLSPAPVNRLDDNLSAGGGLDLAWPSPRVLVTRDGGRSFRSSLSTPAGIWGLDFVNPRDGWAVAVKGLYRTRDAGRHWQRIGEPRRPLVRVAFLTAIRGLGLTVSGELESTRNGGDSWRPASWHGRGAALCATGSGQALVANESGGLWRTVNAGTIWTQVAPDLAHVEQLSGWWPSLSCQGANAVESAQAFCEAACSGSVVTHVRQSLDGGIHWQQILVQTASAGPTENTPHDGIAGILQRTATVGADDACLLGTARAITIHCGTANDLRHKATVPRLPRGADSSDLVVQGLDFVGARGWLLLDQILSPLRHGVAKIRSQVWETNDSGSTWRITRAWPLTPRFS